MSHTSEITGRWPTLQTFESAMRAEGFDEVLERRWQPGQVVATHTHDFAAKAVIASGEMWLTRGERTEHLGVGDTFELPRGEPHSERYGADGAVYWVGRRNG